MKTTFKMFLALVFVFSLILNFQFFRKEQAQKNDNSIKFVWEGLERDIPKDGEYIQISVTDENTIYLNPIDK